MIANSSEPQGTPKLELQPRRGGLIIAQGETLGDGPRKGLSPERAIYGGCTIGRPFRAQPILRIVTQGFTLDAERATNVRIALCVITLRCYSIAPAGLGFVPLLPSDLTFKLLSLRTTTLGHPKTERSWHSYSDMAA